MSPVCCSATLVPGVMKWLCGGPLVRSGGAWRGRCSPRARSSQWQAEWRVSSRRGGSCPRSWHWHQRACRDLALAIETLAARPGLDAALEAATARLKDGGDQAAFDEQQRLRTARDEADRQLATLFEGGGD